MHKQELIDMIYYRFTVTRNHEWKAACSDILDKLLEAGMLPPKIVNPFLKCKYKDHNDFIEHTLYPNCVDYGKNYWIHEFDDKFEHLDCSKCN